MPNCSNPIQCQMAKRVECTCDCGGANHAKLRLIMENPETAADAEQKLKELRQAQARLKKEKRIDRRKRRVEARKVAQPVT